MMFLLSFEVDIEKLLQILKRILIYLSPKIKEKWQIRSICMYLFILEFTFQSQYCGTRSLQRQPSPN